MPQLSLLVRAAIAAQPPRRHPGRRRRGDPRPAPSARRWCRSSPEKFGETLRSLGLHRDDGVVEVYSSEETGTWTILMTRPDGMSCLLAAGQRWEQDVPPARTKPGSDA